MKISVEPLFHPDVSAIEVDQRLRLGGELSSRYPEDVRLRATISRITHGVHVHGTLEGTERETCARCLEIFLRPIHIDVEETFSEDVVRGEDFFASAAPLIGRAIDASDLVEQLLEVDEPLAVICSESCRGICPQCGVNRNTMTCNCKEETVDARLAGLARLRDELEKQ